MGSARVSRALVGVPPTEPARPRRRTFTSQARGAVAGPPCRGVTYEARYGVRAWLGSAAAIVYSDFRSGSGAVGMWMNVSVAYNDINSRWVLWMCQGERGFKANP